MVGRICGALSVVLMASCAGEIDTEPYAYAAIRNHTDSEVTIREDDRGREEAGSASSPTPPCDVGVVGWPLREGVTWWVTVDGTLILDSKMDLPEVGVGDVLEILIDVREGEAPSLTAVSVRPAEAARAGGALPVAALRG